VSALLIYDQDCGFCTRSASWLVDRAEPGSISAVGSSSLDDGALAQLGLSRIEVDEAVWLIDRERRARGHQAIAAALGRSGRLWPALGALIGAPTFHRPMAWAYGAIARNRHRLPGSGGACRLDPDDSAPHEKTSSPP
jgi:predicted DCC family thiol-disulfide oxidoreductase YuxK